MDCKAHNVFEIDDIVFSSNFDNGNLLKVEKTLKANEFNIWSANDNHGTSNQSKHCAWFYFTMTNVKYGDSYTFNVVSSTRHVNLYKFDMRPVYRSQGTSHKWIRIKTPARFGKEEGGCLSFDLNIDAHDGKIEIAFTYPYTYTMLQQELTQFDSLTSEFATKSIYYCRELLIITPDNLRVDLLTISSMEGISDVREETPVHTFPNQNSEPRCFSFPNKEIMFISARVHPGEVPAQHTLKGIIDLLLDPKDPRARELRKRFVFKIIPMLNPDGVYRGHFRMDEFGKNLNRYYLEPSKVFQPAIFATKELMNMYVRTSTISLYLDLHAHASKRGCFIYGNVMDSIDDQVQNQLYCKLIAMNTPHFDYEGCLFSRDHMSRIDPGDELTAEGSARVSMYLQHGIIHSYTLECNYNTGRSGNEVAACDNGYDKLPGCGKVEYTNNPEKYTPASYANVGQACIIAMLDIRHCNPCGRLLNSKLKTLDRVRQLIISEVRQRVEYKGQVMGKKKLSTNSATRLSATASDSIIWKSKVDKAEAANVNAEGNQTSTENSEAADDHSLPPVKPSHFATSSTSESHENERSNHKSSYLSPRVKVGLHHPPPNQNMGQLLGHPPLVGQQQQQFSKPRKVDDLYKDNVNMKRLLIAQRRQHLMNPEECIPVETIPISNMASNRLVLKSSSFSQQQQIQSPNKSPYILSQEECDDSDRKEVHTILRIHSFGNNSENTPPHPQQTAPAAANPPYNASMKSRIPRLKAMMNRRYQSHG